MGSMVKRHIPCGNSSCWCAQGREHWHGPYYQWSWKVNGKTVSTRLTSEQAKLMSSYVRNDRELRRIVVQMRSISLRVVEAELNKISRGSKD